MTNRSRRVVDWFTWGVIAFALVYFFWQFLVRPI